MNGKAIVPAENGRRKRREGGKFRRRLGGLVIILCVVFLAIQLVPVTRSNPTVESDLGASNDVNSILRRACYDCHSNETVWPWYSRLAPVSWALAYDVNKGRKALNYSTWMRLTNKQQAEAISESWEEVTEGKMPTWYYVALHPDAKLSPNDKSILREWAVATAGAARTEEHGD